MDDADLDSDLILLWSGGKDATLTLDVLHSQSPRRVGALLTTVNEDDGTVPMHGTPWSVIERQARSLGIPLYAMPVPPRPSNEVYEARLNDVLKRLIDRGATTVAVGDLFLEDVKRYRERVIEAAGFDTVFPLWRRDTEWLAHWFIERGYRAIVSGVDTTQLDGTFVGRWYDASFLADLPDDVDPCGERGAFHTVVTDGPAFEEPVPVEIGEPVRDGRMRLVQLSLGEEGGEDPDK